MKISQKSNKLISTNDSIKEKIHIWKQYTIEEAKKFSIKLMEKTLFVKYIHNVILLIHLQTASIYKSNEFE